MDHLPEAGAAVGSTPIGRLRDGNNCQLERHQLQITFCTPANVKEIVKEIVKGQQDVINQLLQSQPHS